MSSEERSRNEAVEFYGNRVHDAVRFGDEEKRTVLISKMLGALFKKFCKRDFCDEVRDFKIPEPEAVAS